MHTKKIADRIRLRQKMRALSQEERAQIWNNILHKWRQYIQHMETDPPDFEQFKRDYLDKIQPLSDEERKASEQRIAEWTRWVQLQNRRRRRRLLQKRGRSRRHRHLRDESRAFYRRWGISLSDTPADRRNARLRRHAAESSHEIDVSHIRLTDLTYPEDSALHSEEE